MAIEIEHIEHDTTEYKVLGNVTLPELHIALARGIPEPERIILDLCLADVDASASEIERFAGYVERNLLPQVTVTQGQFLVRANENPMENGALPLIRALVSVSRRSATLQVLTTREQGLTGAESTTAQKPSESLAQRIRRLADDETLATKRDANTDSDLPVVTSEDVAFAAAV